jgi:tRNA wybutosine-synthesizing protein 2
MVLLPSDAITEIERTVSRPELERLYELIEKHLKVTHAAPTRPITLHLTASGQRGGEGEQHENTLRSPTNFRPLYGDFGPTSCSSPPTAQDFEKAYWATAKQNGIAQTWAPRWTMFSRGNISEKARLLTLPSVLQAVQEGKEDGRGCAAVDLYVGIGYFAFSYLKARVNCVIGWDLNPWSIEGLRRGAKANGWKAKVVSDGNEEGDVEVEVEEGTRILAFCESNEHAGPRIKTLRSTGQLPPIRHVNCGLLPTSRGSWVTAVTMLDKILGGWVHVHENFAVAEIEEKAEEVRVEFQRLINELYGEDEEKREVKIESINRLKSYAPGVMHVVVDIHMPENTQSPV